MAQPLKIHNGQTIVRKHPVNLIARDTPQFNHAFPDEIPPTYLLELKRAHILKDLIFTISPLSFYNDHTCRNPVKSGVKFKRLLRLLYPSHKIKSGVWIGEEWGAEYYHWFVDALPRLMSVIDRMKPDTKLLLPDYYRSRSYIPASLEILGVDAYYFNRDKHQVVNELLLPSFTAPFGKFNTQYIKMVRERLAIKGNTATDKIYISRAKARIRRIKNESEVQTVMEAHGFRTYYLEDHSLRDQLDIFSRAKVIAGLHGAGLTNMLFAPSGAQVLELRNEGELGYYHFYHLASDLDLSYYYLQCKGDTKDTYRVNVTVDIAMLEKTLSLMECNEKGAV